MKFLPALFLLSFLTGCASQVPLAIRTPLPEAPPMQAAREQSETVVGRKVRWGGAIASVENRADETWVEIVERALERSGRPISTDSSSGRFFARIPGFLDPAIYAKGRDMTVTGTLEKAVTRAVGEYPYQYPVVRVDEYYLWQKLTPRPDPYYYHDPFWYDPWYSPWWYGPRPRHWP